MENQVSTVFIKNCNCKKCQEIREESKQSNLLYNIEAFTKLTQEYKSNLLEVVKKAFIARKALLLHRSIFAYLLSTRENSESYYRSDSNLVAEDTISVLIKKFPNKDFSSLTKDHIIEAVANLIAFEESSNKAVLNSIFEYLMLAPIFNIPEDKLIHFGTPENIVHEIYKNNEAMVVNLEEIEKQLSDNILFNLCSEEVPEYSGIKEIDLSVLFN